MFILQDKDTHTAVIGALKRTFSRSPVVVEFLKENRVEEEWVKKDGTCAKRNHVFYRCSACGDMFNSSKIQVDHIEPVVPVSIPSRHLSFNTIVKRLFCDKENLQILCKDDHKKKSLIEKEQRNSWLTKTKYIVYETVNRLNGKKYIGVHKCIDYDEVYLGSGTILKQAVKKYGTQAFYRHILHVCDTAEDAYEFERSLVNDTIVESGDYYNMVTGGMRGSPEIGGSRRTVKVICHQTGQVFESVNQAAQFLGVEYYNVSRVLDHPDLPLKNLHFFRVQNYDHKVSVTFPADGRPIAYINNATIFPSIKDAAEELGINYKSLRNSMVNREYAQLASIGGNFFLYEDEYEVGKEYFNTVKVVRLIELQKEFVSCKAAAEFLKCKNAAFGGIAIGRAARTGCKMYGYHWEYCEKQILVSPQPH